jgi:molecular chaperone GrpE
VSGDDAAREESERVVIRDNRKIDPVTGAARSAGAAAAPPDPGATEDDVQFAPKQDGAPKQAEAEQLLEERTRDLQRVQAEYANYRKRADRERLAASEIATGRTLAELLPILDDLERAKAHGDLTGGLKAIADKLDAVVGKLGLVAFGEAGDPFDPSVHEAVLHDESDEVAVPTASTVMRVGYRHGERLLRPAMVGVTDPTHPAPPDAQGDGTAADDPAGTPPTAEGASAEASASPTDQDN